MSQSLKTNETVESFKDEFGDRDIDSIFSDAERGYVSEDKTVALIPNSIDKLGFVDLTEMDTYADETVERTYRNYDTDTEYPLIGFKGGRVGKKVTHYLKKETVETVEEWADIELSEEAQSRFDRGPMYMLKVVMDEYTLVLAPHTAPK